MTRIAIIDFETTGLPADRSARATEIAAVLVEHDQVIGRYQSLMNAGIVVPAFITELTDITNDMVSSAPSTSYVMREFVDFLGDARLIAHNASFDRSFLELELHNARIARNYSFACTMRISRRIFSGMPNHKLETLAQCLSITRNGSAHRALSDAEVTAELLFRINRELETRYQLHHVTHEFLAVIQEAKIADLDRVAKRHIQRYGLDRLPKPISIARPIKDQIRSDFMQETRSERNSVNKTAIYEPRRNRRSYIGSQFPKMTHTREKLLLESPGQTPTAPSCHTSPASQSNQGNSYLGSAFLLIIVIGLLILMLSGP